MSAALLREGGKYYQKCKFFDSYTTFQRFPSPAVTKHLSPPKFTRKIELTNSMLNRLEFIDQYAGCFNFAILTILT